MQYIGIYIKGIRGEQQDLMIYLLSEEGFESFSQEENELHAFIPENLYDRAKFKQLMKAQPYKYSEEILPDQDWNREWEKSFQPVEVDGRCLVRAPFHPSKPGFQYEIIIEPKMSFGTAHHETTFQMMLLMLEMDFSGKKVLDMGSGTGILAILAEKMKASEILAVDNDSWAYENAIENIQQNSCINVTVRKGGMESVTGKFDVILANITRNTLLEQIPGYSGILNSGGSLLMSGFYEEDLPLINEAASAINLRPDKYISKNKWIAARFVE